jgi:hypothetical protein
MSQTLSSRWLNRWTGVAPEIGQKAAAVPNWARVLRKSVPATVLAICAPGAVQTSPAAGPRVASAEPDFGRAAHVHRYCSRRWPAAPGCSGVDVIAGSPSRRSVHADRLQRPQRWTHGVLQRARMPESDCGPPHGVRAPVLTALRVDKRQRTDRNGRRRRSQGSSHRHRASRRYVGRHPHRPGSAVHNSLMHTAFGMDGQGRVRRCCPCVCAPIA